MNDSNMYFNKRVKVLEVDGDVEYLVVGVENDCDTTFLYLSDTINEKDNVYTNQVAVAPFKRMIAISEKGFLGLSEDEDW